MKYIDTHCHLDFKDYDADRQEVLRRMKEKEAGAITIGTDLESSKKAVEIAENNENVWACIGIHPNEAKPPSLTLREGLGSEFSELVKSSKVVGIGECGLDWFRFHSPNLEDEKKRQTELFLKQINFALDHNKALMLHCRDTYNEVLDILESYNKEFGDKLRGNAHFFAGSIDQAKRFLDLGFTMSFTGVITFTHDYDEVVKYIPLDSIMSETDAPFVAPVPYRGRRNEPGFVLEVVKKITEIKKEDLEKMSQILLQNAKKMFSLQN